MRTGELKSYVCNFVSWILLYSTCSRKKEDCTISQVRLLFDGFKELFPSMKSRLSANADIVRNRNIETNVCKIQEVRVSKLEVQERIGIFDLRQNDCYEVNPVVNHQWRKTTKTVSAA